MRATFNLGRIAGVRVGVNWSVIVIFGLIAYGLAGRRFPDAYPSYSTGAHIAAGLLTAVVFFVSLLAHEMSHAVLARRNGQRVEGITLWLFGGVARLRGEAPTPGAELRVAGVGPLVSLILGGVFAGVTALVVVSGIGGLAAGALAWLGAINVMLAVFNSIPAAPLDGGRLLRALLWWRTGDSAKAAVWSSRTGQAFGGLLVAFGIFSLFTQRYFGFGGLWLALIGWFLITAASVEGQQAATRGRLASVHIWQVMTPEPVTVPTTMTVARFLDDHVMRHRHAAFPVTDDAGEITGLVTLASAREVPRERREATLVRDITYALAEVVRTSPDEPISAVLDRLGTAEDGRALVFSHGRLVGIVSPYDINRMMQRTDAYRRR